MRDLETVKLNSMKLLHYFITKENYRPVLIHGVSNEVWLENFSSNFKIVRIVSKKINSGDELAQDLEHVGRVARKIRLKTLSITMDILNIYLDSSVIIPNSTKFTSIDLSEIDIRENAKLVEYFPSIKKMQYEGSEMEFAIKATTEINMKNAENAKRTKELFDKKVPYVTYALIAINTIVFLLMEFMGGSQSTVNLIRFGAQYNPLIKSGEYYRLITSVFIHIGLIHFLVNQYSLYLIGRVIERFYGKVGYLIIYLASGIIGSLLSFIFMDGVSAGASGAIFGLFGSYVYFGYYHRIVYGNFLKSDVFQIILINLVFGFISPGINNAAHIGGLIGGFLVSSIVGVKFKTTNYDRFIGLAITAILVFGLAYIGFFEKLVFRNQMVDYNMYINYYKNGEFSELKEYKDKVSDYPIAEYYYDKEQFEQLEEEIDRFKDIN